MSRTDHYTVTRQSQQPQALPNGRDLVAVVEDCHERQPLAPYSTARELIVTWRVVAPVEHAGKVAQRVLSIDDRDDNKRQAECDVLRAVRSAVGARLESSETVAQLLARVRGKPHGLRLAAGVPQPFRLY
jgi:hypothetical protein